MNITQKEAIYLIINFLTPLRNFWKDVPINDILIERFINLGFAELNEEKGKYEINESGTNLLFTYIEQITNDFISYINQKELCCFNSETIEWFSINFEIDIDSANILYMYIVKIINKFGYRSIYTHQKEKGEGYSFIQIEDFDCMK